MSDKLCDECILDTCPICLDYIYSTDNVLCMPVCLHKVHAKCGLAAAQYDTRCSICRTKDPDLVSKQENELEIFSNLEELANNHDRTVRQYNRKRARVINKNSRLGRLQEKFKKEKKNFHEVENDLEKKWMKLQKDSWTNDPNINQLKCDRRKAQRRSNVLSRKLEDELEKELGPKQQSFVFRIDT